MCRSLLLSLLSLALLTTPSSAQFHVPPPYALQWGASGAAPGQFINPWHMTVDDSGFVYVSDSGNNRIQKFTSTGTYVGHWTVAGGGSLAGIVFAPAQGGRFFVVQASAGFNIKVFDRSGNLLTSFANSGSGLGQLNSPSGIAYGQGSLFVADTQNHRVSRFSLDGAFLSSVGSGLGSGLGQMNQPRGVAVDADGNLYVTEWGNNRVQKFGATGTPLLFWTSFAGGSLVQPSGIAVDGVGDVFVVDAFNDRVVKFTPTGSKLAMWGGSGTGDGQFTVPRGVLRDAAGDVYVSDESARRIQKFSGSRTTLSLTPTSSRFGEAHTLNLIAIVNPSSATGRVRFLAGGVAPIDTVVPVAGVASTQVTLSSGTPPGDIDFSAEYEGTATEGGSRSSLATHTRDLGVTSTSLFVHPTPAGDGQGIVLEAQVASVTAGAPPPSGALQFAVGGSNYGAPVTLLNGLATISAAPLQAGQSMTYGATFAGSSLYAGSSSGGGTFAISPRTPFLYQLKWGSPGSGANQLISPAGIATDASDNVYVVDQGNDRIVKYSSSGTYLRQWGGSGAGTGQLSLARGIAVDAQGRVFVTDSGNDRVTRFAPSGSPITWGASGSGDGLFAGPIGIAADGQGNVYVVDAGNNRIQKFTSSGTYVAQWGSSGSQRGHFSAPYGVAVDGNDNVYVSDTGNSRVQKFTGDGEYLGQWSVPGANVRHLSTDPQGNVYATDAVASVVLQFTSDGTLVASWGSSGAGNGQFSLPNAAAIGPRGTLYVSDAGNHRIQKLTPAPQIASIRDVGGDQGGQVRLRFRPSPMDYPASTQAIAFYDVFRKIGNLLTSGGNDRAPRPAIANPRDRVLVDGWDYVGTATAYQDSAYVLVVPTLADSTSGNPANSEFFVRGATAVPGVFFDSPSAIGRSVDNLAPTTPIAFSGAPVETGNDLQWELNPESDLALYRLYRGSTSTFVPGPGNQIATSTTTTFTDPETDPGTYYYRLSAEDLHGNRSGYALAVVVRDAPPAPIAAPMSGPAASLVLLLVLAGAGGIRSRARRPSGAERERTP